MSEIGVDMSRFSTAGHLASYMLKFPDLLGIHWVIVGGESGHGARPTLRDWVVSIRQQCQEQKVPFFFKQWGGIRKSCAGRLLDGRTYDEMPRQITTAVKVIAQ